MIIIIWIEVVQGASPFCLVGGKIVEKNIDWLSSPFDCGERLTRKGE